MSKTNNSELNELLNDAESLKQNKDAMVCRMTSRLLVMQIQEYLGFELNEDILLKDVEVPHELKKAVPKEVNCALKAFSAFANAKVSAGQELSKEEYETVVKSVDDIKAFLEKREKEL